MKNFGYLAPKTINEATAALKQNGAALGGGVELLCLLKERLISPARIVNLKSLPGMRSIESGSAIKIGALVTADAIERDAAIRRRAKVLHEAASVIASPQIRNIGTLGGNLCQRPRCWYFRDKEVPCLKKGGEKCFAVDGRNEYHAILGGGPCFIVHPSDFAPALIALDAGITTNTREMKLEKFFVLPEVNVQVENVLAPGEIVTGVEIPSEWLDQKSSYCKSRERPSFDWALSSCAVVLKMNGNRVDKVRVVLGGVAPIPWRSVLAEEELVGKEINEATATTAGRAAMADALPLADNAYKVELSVNVVKVALLNAIK